MIQQIYNRFIRPWTPRRKAEVSGVTCRMVRLLDFTTTIDDYKTENYDWLESLTEPGDTVRIVGGGFGVSAVKAALATGPTGHVDVFEAGAKQSRIVKETLHLNHVEADVRVHHAAVETPNRVYGRSGGAARVSARVAADGADVFYLDCEGAEYTILSHLPHANPPWGLPGAVIAETHPQYDVHAGDVEALLIAAGYDVLDMVEKKATSEEVGLVVGVLVEDPGTVIEVEEETATA